MRYLSFIIFLLFALPAGATDMTQNNTEKAIFAGGCFWCTEAAFDLADGVISTTSGYINGHTENPSYQQVSGGNSGHIEALEVIFDPKITNYQKMLDIYWHSIDPIDGGGQFFDRGEQYKTAILYSNKTQQEIAIKSKEAASKKLNQEVVTKILEAKTFYPAEEYHQDYHIKNPENYKRYKNGSGREKKLKEIWGNK